MATMDWSSTYEGRLLTTYLAGRLLLPPPLLLPNGEPSPVPATSAFLRPPDTPLVVLIRGESQSGKKSLLQHSLKQLDDLLLASPTSLSPSPPTCVGADQSSSEDKNPNVEGGAEDGRRGVRRITIEDDDVDKKEEEEEEDAANNNNPSDKKNNSAGGRVGGAAKRKESHSSTIYKLFTPRMADILPRGYLGGFANGFEGYIRQVVAEAQQQPQRANLPATEAKGSSKASGCGEASTEKKSVTPVPLILLDQIQRWFPLGGGSVLLHRGGSEGQQQESGTTSTAALPTLDEDDCDSGDEDGDDDGAEPADQVAADLCFFLHLVQRHPLVRSGSVGIICTATTAAASLSGGGNSKESTGSGDQSQQQAENDLLLVEKWISPVMNLVVETESPTFQLRCEYFEKILLDTSSNNDVLFNRQLLSSVAQRAAAKTGGFSRGFIAEVGEGLISSNVFLSPAAVLDLLTPPTENIVASSSSTFTLHQKMTVDLCVAEVVRRHCTHGGGSSSAGGGGAAEDQNSSTTGIVVDVTPTSWASIVGLEEVKHTIRSKFAFHRYQSMSSRDDGDNIDAVEEDTQEEEEEGEQEKEEKKKSQRIPKQHHHQSPFLTLGIPPTTGILLYGPPGTGKTMLAKAVATELHATFLSLSIADLVHGAVGESERILENLFSTAKARAPSVIFFDELQAAFGRRDGAGGDAGPGSSFVPPGFAGSNNKSTRKTTASRRLGRSGGNVSTHDARLTSALLQGLDECRRTYFEGPPVIFMGATNVPHLLEPSLLGPGRLDCHCEVPFPSPAAKKQIIVRDLGKILAKLRRRAGEGQHLKLDNQVQNQGDQDKEEELVQILLEKTESQKQQSASSNISSGGGCCAADVVNLMNQFGLKVFARTMQNIKSQEETATSSGMLTWGALAEVATSLQLVGGRSSA